MKYLLKIFFLICKNFEGDHGLPGSPFLLYATHRLVFNRLLDFQGNFENGKEKAARKTCFFWEKKHLAPRICQAKFCPAVIL